MSAKLEISEWTQDPETGDISSSGRSVTYDTYQQALEAYEQAMRLWGKRGQVSVLDHCPQFTCFITKNFWVTVAINPF